MNVKYTNVYIYSKQLLSYKFRVPVLVTFEVKSGSVPILQANTVWQLVQKTGTTEP